MRLHLNIGSNSGNRESRIREAVAAVALYFSMYGGRVMLSAPLRSAPWGYESDNEFINIGLRADLGGEASEGRVLEIFRALRRIEQSICSEPHRNADGTYRDREIDIDLIAVAGFAVATDELTVPHPRARERAFVMEPMRALEG